MKNRYFLTGLMAAAVLTGLNSAPIQASTVSIPSTGTSYVKKGNTYRLYFKAPVKLSVTTTAKYTIKNTSDWKCISYPSSKKNTKIFYLRAGHYNLTTSSKKQSKIKTSYQKITSIRKSLETYSYKNYPSTSLKPTKISLNQTVKGLSDMYQTPKYNAQGYYMFTLDQDQKVTIDLSTMPVYENSRTNIFNDNQVTIEPFSEYDFDSDKLSYKGQGSHQKQSWNLTKGTYVMNIVAARGRYSFKLTSEATKAIPAASKITKITPTSDAMNIEYAAADQATGYGVYVIADSYGDNFDSSYRSSYSVLDSNFPNTLSQSTQGHGVLINGETYKIAVRTMNDTDGRSFGPVSEPVEYTYYVPLAKGDETQPETPTVKVSYYDDHGSDEPYIDIDWNIDEKADSHEVAYRLKGTSKWTMFFSRGKSGDEITSPEAATGSDFKKGQVYEVRVRSLHGSRKSAWSAVKTTTVTVTPAR